MDETEHRILIFGCYALILMVTIVGARIETKTNQINKVCWNETDKKTIAVPGEDACESCYYYSSANIEGIWTGECANRLFYDYSSGGNTVFYNPKNYTDYCLMQKSEIRCKIEGINTLDGVN